MIPYPKVKKPSLTPKQVEQLRQTFGTDQLYICPDGDIRDVNTNNIVTAYKTNDEAKNDILSEYREIFENLHIQIQQYILDEVLKRECENALATFNRYNNDCKLTYKILSQWVAEKELLK